MTTTLKPEMEARIAALAERLDGRTRAGAEHGLG